MTMPPPVNLTRDEQRRLIHAVQTDPQWSHMTPDDILGTAQTVFVKLARHLTSRGYETTPAQARELMHKHRYDISPELVLTDALAFFDFEPGSDEAEYMRGQFELLGKDGFLEWLRM
jgi:hypothetical protein